jgi:hypothetical protein
MKSKIDRRSILRTVMANFQHDRKKTSLYISESVFKDFKSACDGMSASAVIEELMRGFVESYERKPPR